MVNIFVIYSGKKQFWKSCKIIENAHRSVMMLLEKDKNFSVMSYCADTVLDDESKKEIKLKLKEGKRNILYSYGHTVELDQVLSNSNLDINQFDEIHIAIFGDITIETNRWDNFFNSFKAANVILHVASPAYEKVVSSLVKTAKEYVKIIPYSLDEMWFSKLSCFDGNTINITYAGRLTYTKGLVELIKVAKICQKMNAFIRFDIAGEIDFRGEYLHALSIKEKNLTELVEKELLSLSNVKYHGYLNQQELLNLFDKTDYIISLSTYHDEDFGYSVAQARARGCGMVITQWGGLKQYVGMDNVYSFPVSEGEGGLFYANYRDVIKKITKIKKLDLNDREKNQASVDYLRTSAISEELLSLFRNKNIGQLKKTEVFTDYNKLAKSKSYFSKKNKDDEVRVIYDKIYNGFFDC